MKVGYRVLWQCVVCASVAFSVTACSSDQTLPLQTPTLPIPIDAALTFWEHPFDLRGMQWMEEQAEDFGVWLELSGVYALDKDTAFVYGGIGVPAGIIRSVLLRSADGGQSWQEVMEPVAGSSTIFMDFVDENEGWALALWTVEGAGPMTLYHTTDSGLTWATLGEVPKSVWYGYPLAMNFSDHLYGQIDVIYDAGEPVTNRIAYLTTQDGGVSWRETDHLPLGEMTEDAYAPYQENIADRFQSVGSDGSLWRLREETAQFSLSLDFENTIKVYLLPIQLHYVDGKIAAPAQRDMG